MINRIFLILIVLASLTWISYVSLDVLSDSNNYDPNTLFGEKDGQLLIINRPTETDIFQIKGFETAPLSELASQLSKNDYSRAYISQNQAHILLQNDQLWNEEKINSLFNQTIQFNGKSFTYENLQGRYYKKGLYLSQGQILNGTIYSPLKYDKKASASSIKIGQEGDISSVSDIYFKDDGRVDYVTHNAQIEQGKQVKDELIFSNVVTSNFSSYHFYERDYYATLDSTFLNGPMSKWMLNGFLELDYNGKRVLITDYIGGQDPILVLNDLQQTLDTNLFSEPLLNNFPQYGNQYCVKYLEDLVVISESENACNGVLADFKLGNTIALNSSVRNTIYGTLPASVSERIVTNEVSYSKAVYKGQLLETLMGTYTKQQAPETIEKRESIAMNCGFDILDFTLLKGNGNISAVGKNQTLKTFENGQASWEIKLDAPPLGNLQTIDLHNNGDESILINTASKIHLWDKQGNYHSGFPIQLPAEATNEVKFYRWRGKSYFIIALNNRKVLHLDAKGRELNIINSKQEITRQIDVWASQQKLFAGFANKDFFQMYNLDNYSSHREFPLPTNCLPAKVPNQLFQFGLKNNQLIKVDQKGLTHTLGNFERSKLIGIQKGDKNPIIIVQSKNEIHLVNMEGLTFSRIPLPFNEVEDVFIQTTDSGQTKVAIIDGLENNVYLYRLDDQQIINKPLEGQTKVSLNLTQGNGIITSVVDQFVVQYFDN